MMDGKLAALNALKQELPTFFESWQLFIKLFKIKNPI